MRGVRAHDIVGKVTLYENGSQRMHQHRLAEQSEDGNQIQIADAAPASEQSALSPAFAHHSVEPTAFQAYYVREEAAFDDLGYTPPSTRPRLQPSADHLLDLPASLRPAYGMVGRPKSPSDDFMAAEEADQTNMMRIRQDRIDCWIDGLESQCSTARTQITLLEETPLTEDLPTLPRTASGQPRKWKGQQRKAVPVPSMHGSILIATRGPSGEQSRTVSSRRSATVPFRRYRLMQTEERGGDVVVESPWRSSEVLLTTTLCLYQALMFYPYGQGLTTATSISSSLLHDTERSAQELPGVDRTKVTADAAWIAASYPLTHAAFSLLGHQLGTLCGHRSMLLAACILWTAFQLGCAFAPSVAVLCILRAFAGIGAAFVTSSVIALVVCMPAGRKRAMAIGLMGAMAIMGASAACVLSALLVQLTAWKWSFIAPACCGVGLLILAWVTVPRESGRQCRAKVDLIGSYLGIAGFCLFNFVFNQARVVGWDKAYIYVLIPIALGHILSFFFWETRIASEPVLPVELWRSRYFPRTVFMTLCSCLSLGVFLWYFGLFGAQIRKYSLIENGANYQPVTALAIASIFAGFQLLTWASAKYVLAGVNLALILANTLLAAVPSDLTFWGMMFPAVCIIALSATLVPVAGRAVGVESLEQRHQSIAVTLLYAALSYGLSTGIGIAGTVETISRGDRDSELVGYQCAFIFAVAPAGIALVGSLMFLGGESRSKTGGFERMKESNKQAKLPRRLLSRVNRPPAERGFVVERRQPTIIVS